MPRLKYLMIAHSIWEEGYVRFGHIVDATPRLEVFRLVGLEINLKDLGKMAKGWPYLKRLEIAMEDDEYDDEILLKSFENCHSLRFLHLHNVHNVENREFRWKLFKRVPTLRTLVDMETTTYGDYMISSGNRRV